ncbi:MAG TPA: HK97 family phage prohead protease [Plantibacter sp.]|uniref:HK97 family phage prohead protease n=1 Tax=Plantibacter sp. TaxID=1871045 RepID=UPI002C609C81|nr:HK97 family phage prohead protease [Plantibacter sp.]
MTRTKRHDTTGATGQEKRYVTLEDRAVDRKGDAIGFRGHAALFERRTWIGPKKWGFWEQVARGAFTKSIGESDVRFLINHDPNLVLARTTSGTLRLAEDSVGLLSEADLARTSYGEDLAISLERGDVTQMSFAFEVIREEWEDLADDSGEMRTILEAKLWDVSAVTFPAYDDTDGALRSQAFDALAVRMGLSTTKRSRLIAAIAHEDPTPEALKILRDARAALTTLLDDAPAETTPAESEGVPAPAESTRGVPLSTLKRRHQLVASRHRLSVTPEGTP